MRDDVRREIVVAFRGSHELWDIIIGTLSTMPAALSLSQRVVYAWRGCPLVVDIIFPDGNLALVPLISSGIEKNNTASVHAGFLISYNSVRAVVVDIVRGQLRAFPNYRVVLTGMFVWWYRSVRLGGPRECLFCVYHADS